MKKKLRKTKLIEKLVKIILETQSKSRRERAENTNTKLND